MQASLKRGTGAVDVNPLRRALAITFGHTGEFEVGSTGDSMETLDILLSATHAAYSEDDSQGASGDVQPCQDCPVHSVFHFGLSEQLLCDCGHTEELQWDESTFMYPYYVSDVLDQARLINSWNILHATMPEQVLANLTHCSVLQNEGRLPELLRQQWEACTLEICSRDDCEVKQSRKILSLKHHGQCLVLHCIWPETMPQQLEILQVVASIPLSLKIDKLFCTDSDTNYGLHGVVAYGPGHYVFYGKTSGEDWMKFDDDRQSRLGKWYFVVIDMVKNHYHPTGLVYSQTEEVYVHDISLTKWFQLEQEVLKKEREYMEWLRSVSTSKPRVTSLRTRKQQLRRTLNAKFATSLNAKPVSQSPDTKKHYAFRLKKLTESTSIADRHWECLCGHNNHADHRICASGKCIQPGVEGWICPVCTFLNSTGEVVCRGCHKLRPVANSTRAGKPPGTRLTCPYCSTTTESSACKCGKVSKKCFSCQRPCTGSYCKQCMGRNWKCRDCGTNNDVSKPFCGKCFILKTSQSLISPSLQSPGDQCQICKFYITDDKICGKCNGITTNWYCSSCLVRVPLLQRVCLRCSPKLKQCPHCTTFSLPHEDRCSTCWAASSKTAAPSRPSKPPSCQVCPRFVNELEKRNCRLCGKKASGHTCNRCKVQLTNYICDVCKHTRWVCNCATVNWKSNAKCAKCRFINTAIRVTSRR